MGFTTVYVLLSACVCVFDICHVMFVTFICEGVYSASVRVPQVFEELIRRFDLTQRISVQREYLLECIH